MTLANHPFAPYPLLVTDVGFVGRQRQCTVYNVAQVARIRGYPLVADVAQIAHK